MTIIQGILPSILVLFLAAGMAGAADAGPVGGDAPVAAAAEADPAADRALAPEAALRLVMDRSPAGIHRRFGPDAAWYAKRSGRGRAATKAVGAGGPAAPDEADARFPKVFMRPAQVGEGGRRWQIGGPWKKGDAGDYSSSQGQVLYAGGGVGIDRVTVIEMAHGCFTESPEPPWWGGFRPEPHTASWGKAAGGGAPVGIGRGIVAWSNCGIIVYANGLVCTAGTCTAFGSDPVLRLPPGKLPTAICVTPRNEFAIISIADTTGKGGAKDPRAQLAIIALTGLKKGFAHEWQSPHPGMPNVAMIAGMKLVGFVDLPGMSVPTAVSASSNNAGGRLSDPDTGHIGSFRDYHLDQQKHRSALSGYVSSAGWAVVAATYEDKVAFVDLQPLFQHYRARYCGEQALYQQTRDQGPSPSQWPTTFDYDRAQLPVVVKTVKVPEPTAVLAGLGGDQQTRAYVACRDGRVAVFGVGGLASGEPVAAGAIEALELVEVGRNPVSLAYQRYDRATVIAVCRGDRELDWITTSGGASKVVRRLRDARLVDPVACEVAETHGIETGLVTVCDFKGRKIANYRFSPLVFATNGGARFGMGPKGEDQFECGGVLEFPGPPFAVCATNVN